MTPLSFLSLNRWFILDQLRLEEALLRADSGNWCILNWGSTPAIVVGISGKIEELLDLQKVSQKPVPIIRRFSGGGTVIVNEDTLFVTFIFNQQEISIPGYPHEIMKWTENFYQAVFHPEFHLRENDYVIGERKFGGNAQYVRKERWLHHSSLLWDFDQQEMNYLKIPKKMPTYRKERSHTDFLCRLKEFHSTKEEILQKIESKLRSRFTVTHEDPNAALLICDLPHRKATELLDLM